ncbi:MAG: HigA family addiction module antitoxin [Gammaproteobacteria bacterium]|nr:HigA family addiction module antitoxin [Gammaproteobacteria bacterium]
MTNRMRPIHPGEQLKEELDELGLSATAFAGALGVPANRITEILRHKRGITADTALRLARYFGTSADYWMNLQKAYEKPDLHPCHRNRRG